MEPEEFIRRYCGLDLRDFQKDWLEELFETKDGERVRTQALWGVPRGNGKTEIAAAIALYMLVADVRRAEVYIAAGSRDQATLAFKAAKRMVQDGPLVKRVKVQPGYRRMSVPERDAHLHVISAEGPLQHGLQPTCVIFDELWVQKKRDLFEALAGGLFKRPQTLLVCISTAGFDPNSLLAQECKRGEAGEDPRFLYRWEQAPEALPYDDPETWRIANPALRCERPFMRVEGLEDDLRRMHENEFRRWHLNQWTASEATWITADVWDACAGTPTLKPGLPTVIGVDASIRRDATAAVTVQRDSDGVYHAEFRIWEPKHGQDVPLEEVENHIRTQGERYELYGVPFDPQFFSRCDPGPGDFAACSPLAGGLRLTSPDRPNCGPAGHLGHVGGARGVLPPLWGAVTPNDLPSTEVSGKPSARRLRRAQVVLYRVLSSRLRLPAPKRTRTGLYLGLDPFRLIGAGCTAGYSYECARRGLEGPLGWAVAG